MKLTDLMEKTQKVFVGNKSGLGCEISYKVNSNGSLTENIRALASEGDFRRLSNDKDVIQDEMSFLLVSLPFVPNRKDVVTYNDEEYQVEDFRPNGNGRYDLFCRGNATFTGGTSKRVGRWQ